MLALGPVSLNTANVWVFTGMYQLRPAVKKLYQLGMYQLRPAVKKLYQLGMYQLRPAVKKLYQLGMYQLRPKVPEGRVSVASRGHFSGITVVY
jgi:hypothetical protein